MTLSQLIAHALRQLDENAEDVSEYEESFKVYANMGYDIAVREYLKPRRTFCVDVDEKGNAPVPGLLVTRVVELRDEYDRDVGYDLDPDGRGLHIWRDDLTGKTLRAVCEVAFYPMEDGSDEPQIPECAQAYLADYICYRHLSNGNPVKQRQAQFYLNSFLRGMQRLRPQGMGSVTHCKHIYDVTDARYCR